MGQTTEIVSLTDAGEQIVSNTFYLDLAISPDGSKAGFVADSRSAEAGTPAAPFGALTGFNYYRDRETEQLTRIALEGPLGTDRLTTANAGDSWRQIYGTDKALVVGGDWVVVHDYATGANTRVLHGDEGEFGTRTQADGSVEVVYIINHAVEITAGGAALIADAVKVLDVSTGIVTATDVATRQIEAVAAGSWSYQFTEAHEFVSASSEGDWALMTIALRGSQTGAGGSGFRSGTMEMDYAVFDRATGTVTRLTAFNDAVMASVPATGGELDFVDDRYGSWAADRMDDGAMSADGAHAVFTAAGDLAEAGDSNGFLDVFRWTAATGAIELVSVDDGGNGADDHSFGADISDDGRFVSFFSEATDVGGGNTSWNVYVRDMELGETRLVSTTLAGDGSSYVSARAPAMSDDGRWIVFDSINDAFVEGDANGRGDVFVAENPFLAEGSDGGAGKRLVGTKRDDKLKGGGKDDFLRGKGGDDVLKGRGGDDELRGDGGADKLLGGGGDDLLIGGKGRDLLVGGGGADVLVFGRKDGFDTVKGFKAGVDEILVTAGASGFEDLEVSKRKGDALVAWGRTEVWLKGVDKADVDEGFFDFA